MLSPSRGPPGIIPPPPGWLQKVYDICKRNGILYIDDEVFAGLGRTGRMFAIEEDPGIDPDMIVVGKTLGGGILPMSAVVMKEEVAMSIEPGATSSTLHGYPLGAAVATKVIETIQEERSPCEERQGG